MFDEYNLSGAFRRIEEELIASMIRNLKRHRAEEDKEGVNWSMWQAEQLKALEQYRRTNRKKYGGQFRTLNSQMKALIRQAKDTGSMEQEILILRAIQRGYHFPHMPQRMLDLLEELDGMSAHQKIERLIRLVRGRQTGDLSGEFFRMNERKLEALIRATTQDMEKAETAVLRMANDQYRKIIFSAQVYANTGAGTYEKAVDMATKDFLAAGLNCIEYKNGARHTISDYADMAIRTASKRAYLAGEGEMRKKYGIATVIVNKRGNPCPKCLPFCGKVLIDDVWSGGSRKDGNYPLMSTAIAHGLYHPRCKDVHTTYFPGISTADDSWTEEELEAIRRKSKAEAEQQYARRQEEKYGRLVAYSLDPENKKRYYAMADNWREKENEADSTFDILSARDSFIKKLRKKDRLSLHIDKMCMYGEFTDIIESENLNIPFAYIPDEDVIKYNPGASYITNYDIDYVFTHEITHRMDILEYHSWQNKKFLQAIDNCARNVYNNKSEIQKWFEPGGKYVNSFALSDIINALSEGYILVPVGHDESYWKASALNKPMEIFANLSSIDVLELNEREEILDELFKVYQEMTQ